MSQTEYHYGKLRKVDLLDETKEEFFERICRENGENELEEDTWEQMYLYEVTSEKYIVVGDDIYEVFDHDESEDSDIQKLIPHEDGTYTFVMSFYNGGTCLSECLQYALKDLK